MSRKEQLEEIKSLRQTYLFFGAGLLFLIIFFFVGVPLLIDFSAFLSTLFAPKKKVTKPKEVYLQRPQIEIPYEATKSGTLKIEGFGPVKTKISLFVNDDKFGDKIASSDGTFSFDSVNLKVGANEIYAVAKNDKSDAEVKSEIVTLTFDNKPPKLELSGIKDGDEILLNNQITIKGKTDEETTVFVNGNYATMVGKNNFTYDYLLNDGENKITVSAVDRAGNETKRELTIRFRK